LNSIHRTAREALIASKERSKQRYDTRTNPHELEVGDLVYVKNLAQRVGRNKKLDVTHLGPYSILRVNDNNTALIKIGRRKESYHFDRLKPCTDVTPLDPVSDSSLDLRPSTSRNTRRSYFIKTGIVSFFLLLLLGPTVQAGNVKNTILPITYKSGLYFENLGKVKITSSIWQLIKFRDMSVYNQRHNFLAHCMQSMNDLCTRLGNKNQSKIYDCNERLALVRLYETKMKETYETVEHLVHHSLIRQKRFLDYGLLPVFSTLQKWLIDTPDVDDNFRYDRAIDRVLGDGENTR